MNKLIIDELYIFSLSEKLAKKVSFSKGCNIVTSDNDNGNDRGKSTIMKSIYYTLGADTFFTTTWKKVNKCYLLKIEINEAKYYIFRSGEIFKCFDESLKKIFETNNRNKLGKLYKEKFGFYTFLPKRGVNIHEITPPVFNFIINYTDQTRMQCTELKSFDKLTQYSGYKKNILWEYMGVYNEGYFDIRVKKDKLEKENKDFNKIIDIKNSLIEQIDKNINNIDYSVNYDNLKINLEENKEEYLKITKKLSSLKKNLIKFRNAKENTLLEITELEKNRKESTKNCKDKPLEFFNEIGNLLSLKIELDKCIVKLNKAIEDEEKKYIEQLNILKKYEEKLNLNDSKINNIIEYKGMVALRDSFLVDINSKKSKIKNNKNLLTPINKQLKKDKERIEEINNRYRELMKKDIKDLNLVTEINDEALNDISNDYTVGGSNIPLATIMYYMNMLQLKNEFNTEGFIFPVILDSPNNTESDQQKKDMLYNYIFSKLNKNTQYIISGIGIDKYESDDNKFDKVIKLVNEKYKLLNSDDYTKNIHFLDMLLVE